MSLPVFVTGARPGDVLVPTPGKTQSKGSEMVVISGKYPASKGWWNSQSKSARDETERLLTRIQSFQDVPLDERLGKTENIYLHETGNLVVKVNKLGPEFVNKLGQEKVDEIVSREEIPIKEFYGYFVSPSFRKKGRTTLIFRPSLWSVQFDVEEKIDSYKGLSWDVEKKEIRYDQIKRTKGYVIDVLSVGDHEVGILSPVGEEYSKDDLFRLGADTLKLSPKIFRNLEQECQWFPPSLFKSLIQKIVRTGCVKVETMSYGTVNSIAVIWFAFVSLFTHPGSLVPNLRTWVKGQTSALKRLAVSIAEDSSLKEPDYLTNLLALALVSRKRQVNLTKEMWLELLDVLFEAVETTRLYQYSTRAKTDFSRPPSDSLFLAAHFLNEAGALKTDIPMLFTIAQNGAELRPEYLEDPIETMRIERCVDHHSVPAVAYFFQETRKNFGELFRDMFDLHTGVNPRKPLQRKIDLDFVLEVEQAQEKFWIASAPPLPRKELKRTELVSGMVPEDWISAIIGTIQVRVGKKLILLCLRPDNLSDLVTIEKPTQAQEKIGPLSEEEKTKAIEIGEKMLRKGYAPTRLADRLKWLGKKITVYLEEDSTFSIKSDLTNGKKQSWKQFSERVLELPVHYPLDGIDYLPGLGTSGSGVEPDGLAKSLDRIDDLLDDIENNFNLILRLIWYLDGSHEFSLAGISRDGSGVEYTPTTVDLDVNIFLTELTTLMPGVIKRTGAVKFKILFPPVAWELTNTLREGLYRSKKFQEWKGDFSDRKKRILYTYQTEVVDYLLKRNHRGNLMWLKMGAGKTLIVLTYLVRLIEQRKMPGYVIYTLPLDALETVTDEIQALGFEVNHVTSENKEFKPQVLNLIGHDLLKKKGFLEPAKRLGTDLLLIIDEIHFCMNPTQRTTAVLELSKSCYRFVGMSGTIIKDRNIRYLIPWLSQMVSFEVDVNNFWVAMSAVISKKIDLKVPVDRKVEKILLTQDEEVQHSQLLQDSSYETFGKAVKICRDVCFDAMVEDALDWSDQNKVVFVVLNTKQQQLDFKNELIAEGIPEDEIFLISRSNSINYNYEDPLTYRFLLTTIYSSTGYSITKASVLLTSVYFTGQHVRDQLEGRLIRPTQKGTVVIRTYTTGVLNLVMENYNAVRNMATAFEYALM